jgi:hypothetical protein
MLGFAKHLKKELMDENFGYKWKPPKKLEYAYPSGKMP